MATCLWRNSFRLALGSSRGVRAGALNGRRAASTFGGGGSSSNLIIVGVGVAAVTTFAVCSIVYQSPSLMYVSCFSFFLSV